MSKITKKTIKRVGQVSLGVIVPLGVLILGWLFVDGNRASDKADAAIQTANLAQTEIATVQQLSKDTKETLQSFIQEQKKQNDNFNTKLNLILQKR